MLRFFFQIPNSLLIMVSFNIHVSHDYVTIGLIAELYSFNFALFDMSLLWEEERIAKRFAIFSPTL